MGAKEQRIRKITSLYYSKPEVQKAISDFSQNREVVPRYFEGFGKRPDFLQYPGDVFESVKKGATSFHCSEEIWEDPMKISSEKNPNEIRTGWDLLIDIDCKWLDYSKLAAKAIIEVLKEHNVKNVGLKFSGSKGFHILIPWKAFPKKLGGSNSKDLFPELPRKIAKYIRFESEKKLSESLPEDFYSQFKNVKINRGKKCRKCNEIANAYDLLELACNFCNIWETKKVSSNIEKTEYYCPTCRKIFEVKSRKKVFECRACKTDSLTNPNDFSAGVEVDLYELMGLDIILVSPRHLFRAPYSLHEKTALASAVISPEELSDFQPRDADPLKVKIKNFMPDSVEGEAKELSIQALDWYKEEESEKKDYSESVFKPIKLDNLSDSFFPPSIRRILEGLDDGRKRALFILLNLFRSIGMEKDEIEKRVRDWNEKNKSPLEESYIKSQISWSYKNKIVPPPNFDKGHYNGIGIMPTEEELRYRNPVAYVVKKSKSQNSKDNFKK
jgi:DNA primase catalytic subunit